MNILFFLTPKTDCAYLEEDESLREAMERMEHTGFTALPILGKDGGYLVDDKNDFIGIVTRKAILQYCLERYILSERAAVASWRDA